MGNVVMILMYIGAAALGVAIFGEGGVAAWFAVILGGVGLNWLIKNNKDE